MERPEDKKDRKVTETKKSKLVLKKVKSLNEDLLQLLEKFNTIRDTIMNSDKTFSVSNGKYDFTNLTELSKIIVDLAKDIFKASKTESTKEDETNESLSYDFSKLLLEADVEEIDAGEDEIDADAEDDESNKSENDTTEVNDSDILVDEENMEEERDESSYDKMIGEKLDSMNILPKYKKIMLKLLITIYFNFYNEILKSHREVVRGIYQKNTVIYELIKKITDNIITGGSKYCYIKREINNVNEAAEDVKIESVELVTDNVELLKGQNGITPDSIYSLNDKIKEEIKNKNMDSIKELLDAIQQCYGEGGEFVIDMKSLDKITKDIITLKSVLHDYDGKSEISEIVTENIELDDEFNTHTFGVSFDSASKELLDELKKLTRITLDYNNNYKNHSTFEQLKIVYNTINKSDLLYPILQSTKSSPLILLESNELRNKFKEILGDLKVKFDEREIFDIIKLQSRNIENIQNTIVELYTPIFDNPDIPSSYYYIQDAEVIKQSKIDLLNRQYDGEVSTSYIKFSKKTAGLMLKMLGDAEIKSYPYIDIILHNYLNSANEIELYPLINSGKFALPKAEMVGKIPLLKQGVYKPKISYTFSLTEEVGSDLRNAHIIIGRVELENALIDVTKDLVGILRLSNSNKGVEIIAKEPDVIIQVIGEYEKDTKMFSSGKNLITRRKSNTTKIKQVSIGYEVVTQTESGDETSHFITYPKTQEGMSYLLSDNTEEQIDIKNNFHYLSCNMFYLNIPTYRLSCPLSRLGAVRDGSLNLDRGRLFLLNNAYYYGQLPNIKTNSGIADWISNMSAFGKMERYKIIEQNSNMREEEGTRYVLLKGERSESYDSSDYENTLWYKFYNDIITGISKGSDFSTNLLGAFRDLKLNTPKTTLINSKEDTDKELLNRKISFEDQFNTLEKEAKMHIIALTENFLNKAISVITEGIRGKEKYERQNYTSRIKQDCSAIFGYLKNIIGRYEASSISSKNKISSTSSSKFIDDSQQITGITEDGGYSVTENYQIVIAMILFQIGLENELTKSGRGYTLEAIKNQIKRIEKDCDNKGRLSNKTLDDLSVDSFFTHQVNSEKLINLLTKDGVELRHYQIFYLKFKSNKKCLILSQESTSGDKSNIRLYIGIEYMKGDLRLTHKLVDAIFTGGSHT